MDELLRVGVGGVDRCGFVPAEELAVASVRVVDLGEGVQSVLFGAVQPALVAWADVVEAGRALDDESVDALAGQAMAAGGAVLGVGGLVERCRAGGSAGAEGA